MTEISSEQPVEAPAAARHRLLLEQALGELQASSRRVSVLGSLAFGEAAWQIMLGLFIAQSGPPEPLFEIELQIPRTQYDRWVTAMTEKKLVCHGGGNRQTLTSEGMAAVISCLDGGSMS